MLSASFPRLTWPTVAASSAQHPMSLRPSARPSCTFLTNSRRSSWQTILIAVTIRHRDLRQRTGVMSSVGTIRQLRLRLPLRRFVKEKNARNMNGREKPRERQYHHRPHLQWRLVPKHLREVDHADKG